MININRQARIWVCSKPVNMRKSFEGLSAVARNGMGRDPLCGDLFLFIAANRKQARVLFWDGQGFMIIAKQLESQSKTYRLSASSCNGLLGGHASKNV